MEELIDPEADGEEEDESGPSLVVTIVGVLIVSLLAAGGGWVIGGMLAPKAVSMQKEKLALEKAEKADEQKKGEEDGVPVIGEEGPNLVRLQPITTNLSFPAESWVRMEISLVVKSEPDVELAELIHQDMLEYLRTLSLQQIQGVRGFRYLRDDMRDRAILRSEGLVENILVRTFVIE